MWSLKPYKSPPSVCPGCNTENDGFDAYLFTGVHILGNGMCTGCGISYYHNWPIGHGADFPISFSNNGKTSYPLMAKKWLAEPLIKAIKEDLTATAIVKREIRRPISQGLLLNCLDPCYGHVLWKLFNASGYSEINPPEGLVVLIPSNCVWLVPDFVAEIWVVEVPLNALLYQIPSVDRFVREAAQSFHSLQLLPVATHLDHNHIDLTRFLRVKPFRPGDFYNKRFCITMIWREDRFWVRTRIEYWIDLVARRFSVIWLRSWLLYRQLRTMSKVAAYIRGEIPSTIFRVTGLGDWGSFPEYFADLRQQKVNEDWERKWCQIYAESQLVIGVHGSNMMIPTALSAGFIELLPRNKIPFVSEDILMKHPPRFQTFLGRHLDLFTPCKVIAQHAVSILNDFEYLFKNTHSQP